MEHASPNLVIAIALASGVTAQVVARHLGIPSIVLLFAAGVLLGPDGVRLIDPGALDDGLFHLVGLGVAIILFEGSLNLELGRLRREGAAIRRLVTLGALVTAIGGALAVRTTLDWSWSLSLLFGTLVIVTGPTVVIPILRHMPLRPRLATVLEAEGLLIDPIGAIVAAVTLQIVLAPTADSFAAGLVGLVQRIGIGTALGLGSGLVLARLLRSQRLIPEGLENVLVLGGVLLAFEVSEALISESGILTATVTGLVMGNVESRLGHELGEFEEHLTVALLSLLFVLLAADVRLADVVALGWPGVASVGLLMFVVRPLGVALCTAGTEHDWRERVFLSWMAPRGIIAAAVASIAAAYLDAEAIEGGDELRALVFLTIATTVVVQGGTAPLMARLVGVRAPVRDAFVILGAEHLGFTLAGLLREDGARVVFIDTNPGHVHDAAERGFPAVFGNGLDDRTLKRARPEFARGVIGLTPNDDVNSLFTGEARSHFQIPEAYVALGRGEGGPTQRMLERQGSRELFDGAKDVGRWNVRIRHGFSRVERFRFEGLGKASQEPQKPLGSAAPFVVLAYRAKDRWLPMYVGLDLAPGTIVAAVLHDPESEEANLALAQRGFVPVEQKDAEAEA